MSGQETVRSTFPTLADAPYPKVTYGLPFYEACAKHARETFHSQRPYIIASNTMSKKTDFVEELQQALGSDLVGTWIGIANHTPLDALLPIILDMREKNADCLITIGGGSSSDGAKLISLALGNDVETIEELMTLPRISDEGIPPETFGDTKPATVPVICIPISLSGGEYSRWAGVTDPKTSFKYQFTHPTMYPALLVLDPQLTRSTPSRMWLGSGVRAIDHCIEGYLSTNPVPESDEACKRALPDLIDGLLRTKHNPDDEEARLLCQLGSNLSMTSLQLVVLKGASHGIGHQLGPLGVPHGETSCILLPAVCKYNAVVNSDKQGDLKDILCALESVQDVLDKAGVDRRTADLGDVLRAIFNALGMPKSLSEVGVGRDKFDDLAQGCLKEVFVLSNPRPMRTKEDVMEVLNMVLE